jgi:branched-subunit amino acid aminotransferase/4-amino-4-deoxychorismate lyase
MRAIIDRGAGVFETMLMLDGRLLDRDGHLRRLAGSVEAVYGSPLPAELHRELDSLLPRRTALVRVSVWPSAGSLASSVEVEPRTARRLPPALTLTPVEVGGGLGCHKWRDRSWLEERRREHCCGKDGELLLLDSDGEVLETERAAVLIVEGGRVVAAPDDARRLPSLTRRRAIAAARDVGLEPTVKPIGFERLLSADQVLVASSVRLIVAATTCGDRQWRPTDIAQRLTRVLVRGK